MALGRLLLRAAVGLVFVGHGTQKLFGWFGGHGPGGTGQFFESAGIRPGKRNAIAAGAAETSGGLLLAAGLATPVAAALITSVMTTAIRRVHAGKGPWVTEGGYEYPAVLLAVLLAVVDDGPGRLSLDAARGRERRGLGWALASVGAGVAASYAADRLNDEVSIEATPREDAAGDEAGRQAAAVDAALEAH